MVESSRPSPSRDDGLADSGIRMLGILAHLQGNRAIWWTDDTGRNVWSCSIFWSVHFASMTNIDRLVSLSQVLRTVRFRAMLELSMRSYYPLGKKLDGTCLSQVWRVEY